MNNQKGSATVILLVVLVVVIAVALVYFVFLKKPGEVAVSPTPKEMAGWKTYTNTEYGFEFKYPPQFNQIKNDSRIAFVQQDNKGGDIQLEIKLEALNPNSIRGIYGIIEKNKLSQVTIGDRTSYVYTDGDAGCGGPNYRIPLNTMSHLSMIFTDCELQTLYIEPFITQILSTFKFTKAVSNDVTSNWLPFKSSFFTLSFKTPSGFEVREDKNNILVAKSPYLTTDIGSDNAFFRLTRYDSNNTRESKLALYRKLLKNKQESTVSVDGSSFLILKGDDWGRFEGNGAGKVVVVFFDASWLEIIERPANSNQSFDPITIGNQILSTFKFTK